MFIDERQRATEGLRRVAGVGGRLRVQRWVREARKDCTVDQPGQLQAGQWSRSQDRAGADDPLQVPDGLGPVATGRLTGGSGEVAADRFMIN
jgi:hypothetical protein